MENSKEIYSIFKKEIEKEILQNEIIRFKFLGYIFGFTSLSMAIGGIFFQNIFVSIFTDKVPRLLPAIFFFLLTNYFFGVRRFLIKWLIQEKPLPTIPRYVNAFIETSLPTIVMIYLGYIRYEHALYILLTPPVFVYFIFIILSALRMSFKISLFTGLVAGIEYFILGNIFYFRERVILPVDFLVAYPGFVFRGGFLILAGGLIGFITSQVEKRLLHSFTMLNERNKITNLFGQHVSTKVVEKLINQSDFISEVKHVCIMFFDIRNFTNFSEKKSPEEVVKYLNQIFDFSIEIINKHNGIINKFLGDGFMAVFGAPVSNGEDVKNAVDASIDIIERIKLEVNEGRLFPTKVGIGLHAGNALTGNVGSSTRKEYTIIGDVVNLASRIEQLNKAYNSELLVSEEVYKFLDSKEKAEFIGDVLVKGRESQVKIYKLLPIS